MFPYQVGIKWYLVANLISISLIISKTGCLFPWALVCSRPCMCPPRVKFLYSPVLWNSCNQTLMFFKARFSGGLLLLLSDPLAGKTTVGLRTLTPVAKLLWYNCFPVCGLPTQEVWDFILL